MVTANRARSLAAIVAVIAAVVMGGWPVEAQPRGRSGARVRSGVTAHARQRGSARVIVHLKVPFTLESNLTATGVRSQRASIAAAQDGVLRRTLRANRSRIRRFSSIPFLALEVDEADLAALAASPEVADVEIDAVAAPTLAESTPLVGATKAWAAGYTGAGWTIATLDTGVDGTHPFLAGKVVAEACFSSLVSGRSIGMCPNGGPTSTLSGAGGPCPLAGCEHGTHVAGIAAGKGSAFSGVAPDATIISVQVFSAFTSTTDCGARRLPCLLAYTSDLILGLEHVYALRSAYNIAAVNMSLGGGLFSSPCDSDSMKTAIDQLRTAGIATVISSGNDGSASALSSPACISTAISVASTTEASIRMPERVSAFSNTSGYLSLLAPGEAILSSVPGGFVNMTGTSMAAPHVTGAWALMKSKRPSASVSDILSAFVASGTPITDPRNGLVLPRLNVEAALTQLPSACDYTVRPDRVAVGPEAGTVAIAVTAGVNCQWSATNVASFLAVQNGQAGIGPGNLVLSYSANPSYWPRTSRVAVADTTVTISQRGLGPTHGDINGDGRADIVLQNVEDGSLTTWWLDGWNVVGTSAAAIGHVSDMNWRVAGSGDLDGDGNTDLVWRHRTEGWVGVWYLRGIEVVSTAFLSINQVTDTNWEIKGVGDLNRDGRADLIWQHLTDGRLGAWLMNGQQVLSTTLLSIGQMRDLDWDIAGVGDVDADGYADLVWQHRTGGWLGVWRMRGTDVLTTQLLSVTRMEDADWRIRGVGDVDGDSRADIIWQNDATGELGVWTLDGASVVNQHGLSINRAGDLKWRVVGPG